MSPTTQSPASVEDLSLAITEEIHVKAPLETTFQALLEELGPGLTGGNGEPMQMKIEAWPGGRWYRDLGNGNGHCWGIVQSIKRPTLLEFCGPLMMSGAVANNVQYRLSEEPGGTLITFHHHGFGAIPERFRTGMPEGWRSIHARAKERAERKK